MIIDHIELTYCLFIGGSGNTNHVKLKYEEILNTIYFRNNSHKTLSEIQLNINDVIIKFRYKIDDVFEKGMYMLKFLYACGNERSRSGYTIGYPLVL